MQRNGGKVHGSSIEVLYGWKCSALRKASSTARKNNAVETVIEDRTNDYFS